MQYNIEMQNAIASNPFFIACPSNNLQFELYHTIKGKQLYNQYLPDITKGISKTQFLNLGFTLIKLAEEAYAFGKQDSLKDLSQTLMNLPYPAESRKIGDYYYALYIKGRGEDSAQKAQVVFEHLVDDGPPLYRLRAIISLGAIAWRQGDLKAALAFYTEAVHFAARNRIYNAYCTLDAQRAIHAIRGAYGDHKGALVMLEKLLPLAKYTLAIYPQLYFEYLNSLAVELCETGRLAEAHNICKIVLRSRFAVVYPEWSKTNEEVASKLLTRSISFVAINRASKVVLKEEKPAIEDVKSVPTTRASSLRLIKQPDHGAPDEFKKSDNNLIKETENKIAALMASFDDAIAMYKQQASQSEESRWERFAQAEKHLRNEASKNREEIEKYFSKLLEEQSRENRDFMNRTLELYEAMIAKPASNGEIIAKLLQDHKQESKAGGFVMRDTNFVAGHQKLADDEHKEVSFWHKIAGLAMLGLLAFAFYTSMLSSEGNIDWGVLIIRRLFVTTAFYTILAYAIRQANKHGEVERYNKDMAVKLSDLAELPEETHPEFRKQLVKHHLGQHEATQTEKDELITSENTVSIIKMALDGLKAILEHLRR